MTPVQYITIGGIVFAFGLAAIVVRIAHAIVHRVLNNVDMVSPENRKILHERAVMLVRALTFFTYGVAAVASVSLAVSRFGPDQSDWSIELLAGWLFTHGINVVVIIVGATIVVRAAGLAIAHFQHKVARGDQVNDPEWQRRASTLGGILTSLLTFSVVFVAILMLLHELAIDVVPILTGAGIAGLAVGFGAQHLVRDVISGFFIILEDQVRVGDHARINGVAGSVEEINLRTIVLRDGEGAVQVFPNGGITALANMSKHFAYAVVDVRVAYSENIDRVMETLREVGGAIENDPELGPLVSESIEILGVDSIDNWLVTIKVRFKTLPLNQGKIASELRRRVVTLFAERGIRPYAGSHR